MTTTFRTPPFSAKVGVQVDELKTLGIEWVVDVGGCSAEKLRDVKALRATFDTIVETLKLRVIGAPVYHQFEGEAGVTGMYLLSESHLCFHTFPEFGSFTLNLYSCRGGLRPNFPELLAAFGESHLTVREVPRGTRTF